MSSDMEIRRLLTLPWTVLREDTLDGDVILRVKEIPSAIGSGATDDEREHDLWDSLTASLKAYLHFGDAIPEPADSPRFSRIAPTLLVRQEPTWKTQLDQQTSFV